MLFFFYWVGRHASYRQPPSKSMAVYRGGYLTVALDSGKLVNTSNQTKLLYRLQVGHPDPEADICLLILQGTELGEGSFVRVISADPCGHSRSEDYQLLHLQRWRYRIFGVSGNPVVVELWGAPGTHNRLRIEKIQYYYPGQPVVPDLPPGTPRPASGG